MRRTTLLALLAIGASGPAYGQEADPARGQQVFNQACTSCHSVVPDENMTGPSLSGLWGRIAGGLASFTRYSDALRSAGVTWDDETLDSWLADPQAFIPDNHMVFAGIPDEQIRADLLAFLREATEPGSDLAQSGTQNSMNAMMGMSGDVPHLKEAPIGSQVTAIAYCPDTYTLTMGDGETMQFWERNL